MTWIVIAVLSCAVIVLSADHHLAVGRINYLEHEVVRLRAHQMYGNHPAWKGDFT